MLLYPLRIILHMQGQIKTCKLRLRGWLYFRMMNAGLTHIHTLWKSWYKLHLDSLLRRELNKKINRLCFRCAALQSDWQNLPATALQRSFLLCYADGSDQVLLHARPDV